jgi:SecD/SecF fusion protein
VVVAALRPQGVSRPRQAGYYALDDAPVISSAEIHDPQAGVDNGPAGTGQPEVSFDFTPAGGRAWQQLTRALVRRGEQFARTGIPPPQASQHLAIALDNRLLAVPAVDFSKAPNGLDPADGADIIGGFTTDTADELATILRYHPLPMGLALLSVSHPEAPGHKASRSPERTLRGSR